MGKGKQRSWENPYLVLGATFLIGISTGGYLLWQESGSRTDELLSMHEPEPEHPTSAFVPEPERIVTLAASNTPDAIPAAPIAETRNSTRVADPETRTELRVYCSRTAHHLIAARLERAFERHEPSVDLVLEVRTDRDCVDHLLMDTADIAMIAGELSKAERARGLRDLVLGYHIVVPVVHASNPIESISHGDLRSLLNGRHTSWLPLGWEEGAIQPVSKRAGRLDDLAELSQQVTDQAAGISVLLETSRDIVAYVSNQPLAFGLVGVKDAQGKRQIRVLEIGHVEPGRDTYLRGAWPLGSTMRAVVSAKPPAGAMAFLDYLQSEPARKVIQQHLTLPH